MGAADPVMADPASVPPGTPPPELLALGPLFVSADAVEGQEECARFFPPGYSEPERKPKPKGKKKKKVRGNSNPIIRILASPLCVLLIVARTLLFLSKL